MTENSRPSYTEPGLVARFVPLLQWAPQYERRWLRPDLIAGLTVAVVLLRGPTTGPVEDPSAGGHRLWPRLMGPSLLLLVAGVFGLFMSFDLFFIFIWYDVSLFPMYLLIAVWGSTRKEYGAMKLTLYLLAGSALILPAIVYLFVNSGMNTFNVMALMQSGTFTPYQQKIAFLLSDQLQP